MIYGSNVTVRDLTLSHASVPDQNGAGIRAEGTNLTVTRVHLIDNQDGILADPVANSNDPGARQLFRRQRRLLGHPAAARTASMPTASAG